MPDWSLVRPLIILPMVRCGRVLGLVPVLVLAGALTCSGGQTEYVRVPLEGADARQYVGRWYDSRGRLELIVSGEAGQYTALLRSPPADYGYAKTALEAVSGGLLISMTTPDGPEQLLVKRVEFDDPSAEGGPTVCLAGDYHVWACHEPGAGWLFKVRAQRRFDRSMALADDFVDWLVRTL